MKTVTKSANLPKFDAYILSHHRWLLNLTKDIDANSIRHIIISTRTMSQISKAESARIRFASEEDYKVFNDTLMAVKRICVFDDGRPRLSCSRAVREDCAIFLIDE